MSDLCIHKYVLMYEVCVSKFGVGRLGVGSCNLFVIMEVELAEVDGPVFYI